MKNLFSVLAFALCSATFFTACENPANFNKDLSAVNAINVGKTTEIAQVGKIYVKDDFLYVNEARKGIHVIDNIDPSNPKIVDFIAIEGNLDIAMKGDYIYADSYNHLWVQNVKTKKVNIIKNAFPSQKKRQEIAEQIAITGKSDLMAIQTHGANPTTGTAGSMARFAIVDNVLYVIEENILKVYDITDQENPVFVRNAVMDGEVETIFPYQDKLFVGGTTGMYIYDNADPAQPKFLSKFEHLMACDPVAVDKDIAYITLRNGTPCRAQADNLLQIVDVKNPKAPTLIKEYPMSNPHGLSIKDDVLYICDGDQGVKVFDVSDSKNIKTLSKLPEVSKAYDVINMHNEKHLIVVGKDGIYQYDNSNPKALKQLSKLEIRKTS